jgi:hypothetical protein
VKRWPWEHKLPVALMLLLMVCHGPFLPGAHCSRRLLTGGSTVAPGVVVVMARQPEKLSLQCWFSEVAKPVTAVVKTTFSLRLTCGKLSSELPGPRLACSAQPVPTFCGSGMLKWPAVSVLPVASGAFVKLPGPERAEVDRRARHRHVAGLAGRLVGDDAGNAGRAAVLDQARSDRGGDLRPGLSRPWQGGSPGN